MSAQIEAVRDTLVELGWTADPGSVRFLAEGEYHENWCFSFRASDGSARDAVFRVNHGSQLNLDEQIAYEYRVLESVEPSGRTPAPLALAAECRNLGHGALAMSFIDGRQFDYKSDSLTAATAFARIHSKALIPGSLIHQNAPLSDVAAECRWLLGRTETLPSGARDRLLAVAEELERLQSEPYAPGSGPVTVCNTEVNSGNWIVADDGSCLVDWEKAVVSDPVQDLAHFVSPTTTLWKTDFRFDERGRDAFIGTYWHSRVGEMPWSLDELIARTGLMERAVRLRALSWCFMAHEEYASGGRTIINEDTWDKLEFYYDSWEELLLG